MVITMNDELIELVTVLGSEENENGFQTEERVKKVEVFVEVRSVGCKEYYEAVRSGRQASIIFVVDPDDFSLSEHEIIVGGETKKVRASKVIYDGITYLICRTYRNSSGRLEMTCREVE